jgi:hypothetical protein
MSSSSDRAEIMRRFLDEWKAQRNAMRSEQEIADAVARRLLGEDDEPELHQFFLGNRVQFNMPPAAVQQQMLYLGNISMNQSEITEQWQKIPMPEPKLTKVDSVRAMWGLPPIGESDGV